MKKLSKSKNLSARRLLLMMVNGEHTSYCQRKDLPASECTCLRHEVKQWQERMAASAKNRVKRPSVAKPKKVHVTGAACGKRPNSVTTNKLQDVTCGHCLKLVQGKGAAGGPSRIIASDLTSVAQALGLHSAP